MSVHREDLEKERRHVDNLTLQLEQERANLEKLQSDYDREKHSGKARAERNEAVIQVHCFDPLYSSNFHFFMPYKHIVLTCIFLVQNIILLYVSSVKLYKL